MTVKVLNIVSQLSKTRFLVQYELCEGRCGFNESAYISKQKWNYEEVRCEYKEWDDSKSCEDD